MWQWQLQDIDETMNSQSNGLMQERRNSSAVALELRLFCINPSIRDILYLSFTAELWNVCS